MSLEAALPSYWEKVPALRHVTEGRIWPITAKQSETLPYMTWQVLSFVPVYHFRGRSNLLHCTVQVDCWARSTPEAQRLSAAMLTACDGKYYGKISDEIDIRSMTLVNDLEVPETPDDGGQQGVYHRAVDLEIWYRIM